MAVVLRVLALGLVAVVGVVLVSEHAATRPAASGEHQAQRSAEASWRSAYSRRFPDCVAVVLWPRTETPTALVIRTDHGRVRRVGLRGRAAQEAFAVLQRSSLIGACRARQGRGSSAARDVKEAL